MFNQVDWGGISEHLTEKRKVNFASLTKLSVSLWDFAFLNEFCIWSISQEIGMPLKNMEEKYTSHHTDVNFCCRSQFL